MNNKLPDSVSVRAATINIKTAYNVLRQNEDKRKLTKKEFDWILTNVGVALAYLGGMEDDQ